MIHMQQSIREALQEPDATLETVDLHRVARILQPLFPEHSLSELVLQVARLAVQDGCRYLVWEPPAE